MVAVIEIVIGDVHARAEVLNGLLVSLGVLDPRGRRRDGFWIVQVGDLLDRRARPEANLKTARLAVDAVDVVLAGNHEVDLLPGNGTPHGAALATLAGRGWPQAAAEVGGWVVTHAGIHPELTHGLSAHAGECVAEINDRWHRRSTQRAADPLFDWVGPARGGMAPYGGVFWGARSEWPPGRRTPWGQIYGHMPQSRPRLLPGPRWLIDLADESQLAALVRERRDGVWEPTVVTVSPRGVTVARPRRKQRRAVTV
ncbi:MAG TPA: metallophosphoesterase [Solirubrobacteraceae bacterium]